MDKITKEKERELEEKRVQARLERNNRTAQRFALFLFVIGSIALIYGLYLKVNGSFENYGNFGDYVGGIVGSFWTLSGIAFFYSAITQQQIDIRINRQILTEYKRELKIQRIELFSFRRVFEIQKFENTFFQLLNYQEEAIKSFDIAIQSKNIKKGRDCFKYFYDELIKIKNNSTSSTGKDIYGQIFNRFKSDLDFYFLNINQILSFLQKFDFTKIDYDTLDDTISDEVIAKFNKSLTEDGINRLKRKDYVNIFKSQLSTYEKVLIFYQSQYGTDNRFEELLLELNILDNLRHNDLFLFRQDRLDYERIFENYR